MTIQAIQRSELWNFNMVPSGSVSLWDSVSPPRWVQMFSLTVCRRIERSFRAHTWRQYINRKARAKRGNKARQMFQKFVVPSTMRAVHLFCARGGVLSSSSPLVPPLPPLLLLLLHPHALPITVRHALLHHQLNSITESSLADRL